ncbi:MULTISPECIES: glycosyltransferase family 4 protein [Rhizobium/Agrobacterium group]|uniref:glycosyltransferase family 4 protein n=1 Tax=Rhizobium/Agrobacterium group TaxID=227290 RepID=UPI0023004BB1|nr:MULTISPECIES: glycosyltransferase family 1 protein [Rhizobium/Agrobacterium group]MDA5633430.1 glycosyltransferase family 1 protein [Agrobacterium sp. ST15.16.024]MDF1889074.1 glycosyltransferase family 1 protein [Rhizobium rhizogenes]
MRILVNMPSQYGGKPSGVARVTFSLLEQLLDQTQDDYILRSPWTREQLPENLRDSRLQLLEIPRPRIMVLDVLRQAATLPALCRRHDIDVLFNADPFGSPLGGKRRVTLVHDLYFKTIPEQIGWRATLTTDFIFRLMMAGSDRITCVSEATRRDLAHFYPAAAGKSLTIHSDSTLKVDPEIAGSARPVPGPYILAVGNATSNKNFILLGKAFARLGKTMPTLHVVHVGRDDAEEIGSVLGDPELKARLIRLSGIDDRQLAELYRHAACLCVPSTYEGFCLPVLEAQQLGCPVICSNRSATPEIAGKGALTFDPADVDGLVAALERLFREPDLAGNLREAGYENRALYSWRNAADSYVTLFREISRR